MTMTDLMVRKSTWRFPDSGNSFWCYRWLYTTNCLLQQ